MLIDILLLILGLGLLVKGADWLISGASSFARQRNVSDLVIGLTIVAFGTSAPELVVNSVAAYQGKEALVFGNVIGSNNFNLFIILGVSGLIYPLVVQRDTIKKEIPISLAAVLLLFILGNDFISENEKTVLSRLDGGVLVISFILFLLYIKRQLDKNPVQNTEEHASVSGIKILVFIIIGLLGLVLGGHLVVQNATTIAQDMGVSEKIIGLTIVAAGTSLPELATSVVAAYKRNTDIAVGNIIGSNIFNIFLILGISTLIRPLNYDKLFNNELFILFVGTCLLILFMFTGARKKLDRWEAFALLAIYLIYSIVLISNAN